MSNPQSNGVNLSEYPLIQNSFSQDPVNQAPEVFEEDNEELDLRQISKVIRRRGWLMLGVGLAVTFLVGSRLMSRPPIYQEKFQLGLMYRTGDGPGILAGFNINEQLYAGYSFDWSFVNSTGRYNAGSHEIALRYDFVYKHRRKIKSPRYF